MSSRDIIMGVIRRSLNVSENDPARIGTVEERLENHPRGTVPARGQLNKSKKITLLKQILESQSASVTELESIEDAPAAIADYCRAHNIGPALNIGENAALKALDWQKANIAISEGAASADTRSSLSTALCAIAETGTLMLCSGADNPTTLNFLPDNHMVIIRADDIFAGYEDGWDRLRKAFGARLPRNVNLISGPSRTGDIEQTILLGAHGPKRLHVLIVD